MYRGGRLNDVIVVGLGAMGSACAWQLAARGLRVLAFDARHPPHGAGSTHGGSRVIRETAFEHPRYVPLVRRAYEMWEDLGRGRETPLFIQAGALYAGVASASVVTGSRRSATEHGVPCDDLSAGQIRARWPVFAPSDGMVGLFEHRGGVLRPELCVGAMLEAARAAGAQLHLGEAVASWRQGPGGFEVVAPSGTYAARRLVLATGPWLLPMLAATKAGAWVERVVQHWFAPLRDAEALRPERMPVYLWEDADGVIFYGFPMLDGAVKCAIHHRGASTTADTVRRDVTAEEVEQTRAMLRRFIPSAAGPHLGSAVCLYTNTADGDFVIDAHPEHPGAIIVSPCSGIGFKFAPAIGEIVADMVEEQKARFDLAPFSLDRFEA